MGKITSGDSLIFFNFRPDRMRQLVRSFIQPDFSGFVRENGFLLLQVVTMTQYDETFTGLEIVNPPMEITGTLGEYLAAQGKPRSASLKPRNTPMSPSSSTAAWSAATPGRTGS